MDPKEQIARYRQGILDDIGTILAGCPSVSLICLRHQARELAKKYGPRTGAKFLTDATAKVKGKRVADTQRRGV